MMFEIPSLKIKDSLKFAKELNEITLVDGDFEFYNRMKWVEPFGMLLSACSIKQFRQKHPDTAFRLLGPRDEECTSYASHMGFFKAISESIDLGNKPGEAIGNNNYLPITEMNLHQIHQDEIAAGRMIDIGSAIESKSSELAKVLGRDNKNFCELLTYLIREIL